MQINFKCVLYQSIQSPIFLNVYGKSLCNQIMVYCMKFQAYSWQCENHRADRNIPNWFHNTWYNFEIIKFSLFSCFFFTFKLWKINKFSNSIFLNNLFWDFFIYGEKWRKLLLLYSSLINVTHHVSYLIWYIINYN